MITGEGGARKVDVAAKGVSLVMEMSRILTESRSISRCAIVTTGAN